MHESRVCNEFRRKQSTALGFGVLLLQDKREKLDQGTYFSDFEALVDKSIRWLPLVALVAAGHDQRNTSATSKKTSATSKKRVRDQRRFRHLLMDWKVEG